MLNAKVPVRAALIDLDGTLFDTVDDITAAANAMLADAGRAPLGRDLVAAYVGKGAAHFVGRALAVAPQAQADATEIERWLPVFLAHYHVCNGRRAVMFPGVAEGLHAMRELGLRLAVVTNKPRSLTLDLLEQFGVAECFRAVVAGGDTEKRKPDPEPLLRAFDLLRVTPHEAVMIGDSINDVQAARAADCRVLVVPYGYNEGGSVQALASDGIVATLLEAADYIRTTQSRNAHV